MGPESVLGLPRDVAVRALQRLAMSAAPAPPPGTMRALRFTEFGTPAEALASAQVALPPVTPDESLVQVHAAGINPSDVAAVGGRFGSEVPAIPGRDFAGVVVPGPRAGDEVWGTGAGFGVTRPGAHAEYVAVPAAFNGGQRERVGPSARGSPAMCVRHCETAMSADLIVSVTPSASCGCIAWLLGGRPLARGLFGCSNAGAVPAGRMGFFDDLPATEPAPARREPARSVVVPAVHPVPRASGSTSTRPCRVPRPARSPATALALCASWEQYAYPGVPGHEPNPELARAGQQFVSEVMDIIRAVTPDAGSYVNETDYYEPDWQRSFWGDNYPRLLEIKHAYDPANLSGVDHGVCSETTGD
jgi:Berberine and berberine like/Alcohol dehydrogenase GroES-like domain